MLFKIIFLKVISLYKTYNAQACNLPWAGHIMGIMEQFLYLGARNNSHFHQVGIGFHMKGPEVLPFGNPSVTNDVIQGCVASNLYAFSS